METAAPVTRLLVQWKWGGQQYLHQLLPLVESELRRIARRFMYFGGMNVEETAEALHIHPNTVIRDWAFAKVWLKRELTRTSDDAN